MLTRLRPGDRTRAARAIDLQLVGATRATLRVGYTYERRWFARLTAPLYVNRLMISEADPELCEREPDRVRAARSRPAARSGCAGRRAQKRVDRLAPRRDRRGSRRRRARCRPEPIVVHLGAALVSRRQHAGDATLAIVERLAALAPVVVTCARECEDVAPAFEATGSVARLLRRPAVSSVGGGFRTRRASS